MALDHPDRVTAAAVLDVVPTGEVWARADAAMALGYWHWAFLAQPAPLPERLIGADPDAFFDLHVRALGLGGAPDRYPRRPDDGLPRGCSTTRARCRRSARTTAPGAGIDREHDDADRGRRRIECPLLALWSARGRAAALLRRRPRRLAAVGPPGHRPGARRQPLPRRGPARAGRRPPVRLPRDSARARRGPSRRPHDPLGGDDRDDSDDRSRARCLRRFGELGRTARPAARRRPRDRVREPAARAWRPTPPC